MTQPQRFEVVVHGRPVTELGIHAVLMALIDPATERLEVCRVVAPGRVKPCAMTGPPVDDMPTDAEIDRFMAAVEEM